MSLFTQVDPAVAFEIAALRLHLVAGMAAADGHVHEDEIERMHDLVACGSDEPLARARLESIRQGVVATPPDLQTLLRSIVDRMDRPELARVLIDDLVMMANSDGHIDPREEGLLRLVCGALEIDPVTLYDPPDQAAAQVSAAELASLVRSLLDLDAA